MEYVRYGIEMKMETHKAIRSQHKTIEETKNNKNDVGLKKYNDVVKFIPFGYTSKTVLRASST